MTTAELHAYLKAAVASGEIVPSDQVEEILILPGGGYKLILKGKEPNEIETETIETETETTDREN